MNKLNNQTAIQTKVYDLLKKIPKGKVTTYKALAQKTGIKNPRQIGALLHKNTDPENIPCYKVVRSDGKIATGYAFGGKKGQIKRLKNDGVTIREGTVNINKYLFSDF